MQCIGCKAAKAGERLPPKWKRTPSGILCGKCVADRYVIRGVTFPVAGAPFGTFPTEIEAAAKYNEAATHYFGEFARLNELPAPHAYAQARGV